MAELAVLLRAFHDAVTGLAPIDTARSLVRRDGVDPERRLHAYAHAYRARLCGVLAADYPKLQAFVGAPAFDELAATYLRAHPPRHPSVREVGVALAGFLAAMSGDPALADLATLERARVEAFDGPDATPMRREDLAALAADAFPALRFALVPSASVLALETNADEVWDAIEQGVPPPVGRAAARTVLVWRRDLLVIHRTLDRDEAYAIRRVAGCARFDEVCDVLAEHPSPSERALELLIRWLDAGTVVRP